MIAQVAHRGPESTAAVVDGPCALAHARLSIIDLPGGVQPIPNEDGSMWLVCNGEFYDYAGTRSQLEQVGHRFRTGSDSEILLHLYERYGSEAIQHVQGQFAFALWDGVKQLLWLGRDRWGIRPIYYTRHDDHLLFGSEIKTLLAAGVPREMEAQALAQAFTTWSPLPGQTMFAGIHELAAGEMLLVQAGQLTLPAPVSYYEPNWARDDQSPPKSAAAHEERVEQLLNEAIGRRLVADVPVGAYLSGGLDSSLVVALAQAQRSEPLHTFSLAFNDADFDESSFQQQVANALDTQHHVIGCTPEDIRHALPDVVRHAETPLLRLSPVPMFLLSKLVHDVGLKVVLTGEGADEFFGGYTIFREAKVRRFMARDLQSVMRPLLLKRLYAYLPQLQKMPVAMLNHFFGRGLGQVDDPCFSHLLRWQNNGRNLRFLSAEFQSQLENYSVVDAIQPLLPSNMAQLEWLAQAEAIETDTFMSSYLLSTQGDRMAMANSVEGRYPFLDDALVAYAIQLPEKLKLRNLSNEKHILKQIARKMVPESVVNRPKQPYRSPIQTIFSGRPLPGYAAEALSEDAVRRVGIFDSSHVTALLRKMQRPREASEGDQMAFCGVLSTQLFHDTFIANWSAAESRPETVMDARQHYFDRNERLPFAFANETLSQKYHSTNTSMQGIFSP